MPYPAYEVPVRRRSRAPIAVAVAVVALVLGGVFAMTMVPAHSATAGSVSAVATGTAPVASSPASVDAGSTPLHSTTLNGTIDLPGQGWRHDDTLASAMTGSMPAGFITDYALADADSAFVMASGVSSRSPASIGTYMHSVSSSTLAFAPGMRTITIAGQTGYVVDGTLTAGGWAGPIHYYALRAAGGKLVLIMTFGTSRSVLSQIEVALEQVH